MAAAEKRLASIKKLVEVLPCRLFLGNKAAAADAALLRRVGVTHVVNVGGGRNRFPAEFEYLRFGRVRDAESADILALLPGACAFIEQALRLPPARPGFAASNLRPRAAAAASAAASAAPGMSSVPLTASAAAAPAPTPSTAAAAAVAARRGAPAQRVKTKTRGGKRPGGCGGGGGGVLVHCRGGISRSVTVVCAYLLWSRAAASAEVALEMVRAKRPKATPNAGFAGQLRRFEATLRLLDRERERERRGSDEGGTQDVI